MQYIKNHGNIKNLFRGSNLDFGFYAWIEENGELTIGEERGREGGILYRGTYKGKCIPWMDEIKKENSTLYTSIVRYFRERENDHKNAVMCSNTMTDMEKLNEIFSINKEDVKKQFPQLYYAILAILDKEKKPCANDYWNT